MRTILLIFCLCLGTSLSAQKQLWGVSASSDVASGTIFRTDSVGNNYTDVYVFNDKANGLDPYGSLIQAVNGKLYGLTKNGGTYNYGTLFQFQPDALVYTKLHDFDSINGRNPYGSLVEAANGKLYGMTHSGGQYDRGVIFEFNPSTNAFTNRFVFNGTKGRYPYGSLTEATDGKLYGLASTGGVDGTGSLFQFDPVSGTVTVRHSFVITTQGKGYDPRGSLLFTQDGYAYGFTRYGKPGFGLGQGGGVLFKYDLTLNWNSVTPLHNFDETFPGSIDGYEVISSVIEANNSKLYGMTLKGGTDSAGTIFEYDLSTQQFTKLHDFNRNSEGY
ncbi:MAG: hypothetical protein N4A46_05925, partial [Schleiferiaceae bacterium]|nr:hypothetical protein [Schleiferiaceae bacterium]